MELKEIIGKIDELRKEIDALRPIDADTEKRIMQKFRLDWNYHSNNLEGNSLTFGETKSFLLHGITAEGKPLKDHLDLKGHNEAILLMDDVLKANRPLTETFIREVHEIILHEPYDRPAITPDGKPTTKKIEIGQYKKTPNHVKTVTGEIFYFATPEETPAQMNDLMDWHAKSKDTQHPLVIAAEFHYKFIRIHPFDDGNGRMARILMNLILMKAGYPPVIIKTQEKEDYFRALKTADGGDIAHFTKYIGEQLIKSMELFLRGAKGESIEDADDVDKEIALLKTKLKEEANKIVYSLSTSPLIAEQSIIPLLNAIVAKLNQFNELFNETEIMAMVSFGDTKGFILHQVKELPSFIKHEMSGEKLVESIVVHYGFREFLKTEDENFGVGISFEITLNKFDYTIKLVLGSEQDDASFPIFYHKKNDEKIFQTLTNTAARGILKQIEMKLQKDS